MKKFIGCEYSTEKLKYAKSEFSSFTSKGDSISGSVQNMTKDEYAMYIDRPLNSINGILITSIA